MTQPGFRALARMASLAALLAAGPALAATQGSLGATSRGAIAISVSLRAPARAAGLGDFTLDGTSAARDVCFSGAARGLALEASGSGPDGALTLANGDEHIAYRVEWLPRDGDGASAPLTVDAPVAIQMAASAPVCAGALGAGRLSIALEPEAGARLAAADGPYTGALTLTLVPE